MPRRVRAERSGVFARAHLSASTWRATVGFHRYLTPVRVETSPSNKSLLLELVAALHAAMTDACSAHAAQCKRTVIFNCRTLITFVESYATLYTTRLAKLSEGHSRYENGLRILGNAERQVGLMKSELAEKEVQLTFAQEHVHALLQEIAVTTRIAEAQKQEVKSPARATLCRSRCERSVGRYSQRRSCLTATRGKSSWRRRRRVAAHCGCRPRWLRVVLGRSARRCLGAVVHWCVDALQAESELAAAAPALEAAEQARSRRTFALLDERWCAKPTEDTPTGQAGYCLVGASVTASLTRSSVCTRVWQALLKLNQSDFSTLRKLVPLLIPMPKQNKSPTQPRAATSHRFHAIALCCSASRLHQASVQRVGLSRPSRLLSSSSYSILCSS